MSVFHMVAIFLRSLLRTQTELAAENLALRQQLAVLQYSSKRPKLQTEGSRDRCNPAGTDPSGRRQHAHQMPHPAFLPVRAGERKLVSGNKAQGRLS